MIALIYEMSRLRREELADHAARRRSTVRFARTPQSGNVKRKALPPASTGSTQI